MIKLVYCLKRRPELTREQFQDYWLNTHAPLVKRHAETLRIRRYVQVHSTSDPMNAAIQAGRGTPAEYDGVAELWFDSIESIGADQSPEAQAAGRDLLEDEGKFIDLANSPVWFAEEHQIIG